MSPIRKTAAFDSFNEIASVRVELMGSDPLIWRQVEVPTSITLRVLHDVVQSVMGWLDYHLWEFTIGRRKYGLPMDEDWGAEPHLEAGKVRLRDVLTMPRTVIDYLYDFGDSWEHRLIITDIRAGQPGVSYPRYVGGERNAPREDSGGIPGFYSMLDVLADPHHPDHEHIQEWLGWTLDSFDFTIFVFIMLPISREFNVPLTAVTAVFTLTLWLRLVGATGSGWLADRIGRKKPLMISIAWFSLCNFIAGFSPSFAFLFFFRALLGIGMGAEWPVGASLAMETWPIRSRGFMAGVMQGSWGLGGLLSAAAYGLLYDTIGWRGLLWIGVLPALAIIYVRKFVNEPAIWVENRRQQRMEQREVRLPLMSIFRRGMLANTATACWWMASSFVVGYSIGTLFATHLQKDLGLSAGLVALPIMLQNLLFFVSCCCWGWVADRIGRRWAMILPAIIAIPVTPLYLLTNDYTMIVVFFALQGCFGAGGIYGQNASYMTERFPTEVRATASGFCYHQGAIFGGLMGPIIAYAATTWDLGFAIPMLIGTWVGLVSFIIALLCSPETKGKQMVADLTLA